MCIEALHEKLNPEVVDVLNEKDPWFAGLRGDMLKLSQFQLEASAGMFDSVVYTENDSRN